ncbi:hypothetical protein ACFSLT_25840 [Novosphingobium resinovorum]
MARHRRHLPPHRGRTGGLAEAGRGRRPHLLRIDPDFAYPEYFRAQDIHLQPGNYHDDALAGFVFHYGSKVFFTGGNDDDRLHNVMAAWCPIDGSPQRIVDLGCGVGQSTTAFKLRFPKPRSTASTLPRRCCATAMPGHGSWGSRSTSRKATPPRSISPTTASTRRWR